MPKVPLNTKLAEAFPMFPASQIQEPDMFGIEVELEGRNIIDRQDRLRDYWLAHNDGSLRNRNIGDQAIEYVFIQPLNLRTTEDAVRQLCAYLNRPDVTVYDSYRTSIHVHVNCLQETTRTILNYITISTILDELLVSQNGEHRIGNNFCLRMRDAEGILRDLINSIEDHGNFLGIHPNDRYSSVNVGSLHKFGTIEFRSLECTTDADRIMHWIHTVQAMKVASRGYENPREIISAFSMMGPEEFLRRTLGPYADKYVNVPGLRKTLFDGMRLAQDFAFCSEWELYEPPIKKKGKEQAYIDEVAAQIRGAQLRNNRINIPPDAGFPDWHDMVVQPPRPRRGARPPVAELAIQRANPWGGAPDPFNPEAEAQELEDMHFRDLDDEI